MSFGGRTLHTLGYADDAAMCEEEVEAMAERLTEFADAALKEADIKNLKAENFKRYGSARKLYNFKVDNIGNY